jgi:nicotinate phosphoribosyltransferase
MLGLRRYFNEKGRPVGDMIYDLMDKPDADGSSTIVDPFDLTRQKNFSADAACSEMLQPFFKEGVKCAPSRDIAELRESALENLSVLDKSHLRFMQPHRYPVGLERSLFERQLKMIKKHKGLL